MAERVDVLAVYDAAIFQRRRKLHLLTDKGAPQRAIDRQRDWLAKAEAARAAVAELIEAAAEVVRTDDEAWAALRSLGIEPEADNVALTNRVRTALACVGGAK